MNDTTIGPGTHRKALLKAVTKNPGWTADEHAAELGLPRISVNVALQGLRKLDLAYCVRDGQAHRWLPGEEPKAEPPPPRPEYINRFDGPAYTCPELRVEPARPGAMDAYRLKSRGIG
jgi:hypothetical protein